VAGDRRPGSPSTRPPRPALARRSDPRPNIAKAFYQGGIRSIRGALRATGPHRGADRAEQPDLVFLSEAVVERALCPVNQVTEIAKDWHARLGVR
jgi:hypothetical protein